MKGTILSSSTCLPESELKIGGYTKM